MFHFKFVFYINGGPTRNDWKLLLQVFHYNLLSRKIYVINSIIHKPPPKTSICLITMFTPIAKLQLTKTHDNKVSDNSIAGKKMV